MVSLQKWDLPALSVSGLKYLPLRIKNLASRTIFAQSYASIHKKVTISSKTSRRIGKLRPAFMTLVQEISYLIRKEVLLEWRQRYALNGMLLYIVSTVLICYLSFSSRNEAINPPTWNALFWIILLFTSVNAVAKSFMQERAGRLLYYYTLASPQAIILSKIVYNALLMGFIALIGYFVYAVVMGNPVGDKLLFVFTILMGSVGFASTLTMVSGIASKAGNNSVLMAILSFPVILPMLLMLIKISRNAMDGLDRSVVMDEFTTLLSLNAIVIALSYMLFPYLWKS
jgi:heme exporter protein B